MTALTLTLLVTLAAPGAVQRNRPRPPAATTPADAGTATPPAAPAPLTDTEVQGRVHAYLSTIDTPVRPAQWKALGPRAVPALEAVVQDPEALPSRRAKALDGLSILGGDRARQVVLEKARSEDEPYGVRASALRGAARMLSQEELEQELKPVLESARQAPVRATAAEVLARHGGTSACAAVRAQAGREKSGARRQFTRALQTCQQEPGR